jgi:hypothetical protein
LAVWGLWKAYSARVAADSGDSAAPVQMNDIGEAEKKQNVGVNDVGGEENGGFDGAAV